MDLRKRITVLILAAIIAAVLCSCGLPGNRPGGSGSSKNGSAHAELMDEVNALAEAAARQYDVGLTFQSEYIYGLAQAEISSLRLCVDHILWLKGEGANLAEVIGDAPYKTWDEIVGAGPGSFAPFYFEGLLCKFRGETAKAEECFKLAEANPLFKETDFYYLRNMSVKDLYSLRQSAAALENKIYALYAPRTVLLAGRTGAEFSPAYHLAMAEEREDAPAEAAQCALNALLSSPLTPSLYAAASAYEMKAGNTDLALEIINEGLFLAPGDPAVNYVAATYSHAAGDDAAAKSFLETAREGAEGDLLERVNTLSRQIGG